MQVQRNIMKNRGLPLSDHRNRPSAFHTAVMMLLIAVMTAASVSGKTPALFRIEAYGKEAYESEADGLSEKNWSSKIRRTEQFMPLMK